MSSPHNGTCMRGALIVSSSIRVKDASRGSIFFRPGVAAGLGGGGGDEGALALVDSGLTVDSLSCGSVSSLSDDDNDNCREGIPDAKERPVAAYTV